MPQNEMLSSGESQRETQNHMSADSFGLGNHYKSLPQSSVPAKLRTWLRNLRFNAVLVLFLIVVASFLLGMGKGYVYGFADGSNVAFEVRQTSYLVGVSDGLRFARKRCHAHHSC